MRAAEIAVDCRASLGEAAVWHVPTQRLFWLDLARPTLFSFDPVTRELAERSLGDVAPLGGLAASVDPGRLVLVKRDGVWLLDPETGDARFVADPLRGRRGLVYNDAGVDGEGRLWLGTLDEAESDPIADVFVVHRDRSWTKAVSGLVICNGPAFSLDGSIMYLSDTIERVVRAYDVGADGSLSGSRVFARFGEDDGLPDGLAVDSQGAVWVAHWGGSQVSRWGESGDCIDRVAVPTPNVTSVAFGGAGLTQLFVTTAKDPYDGPDRNPLSGALFVVDVEVPGREPRLCAVQ